MKTKSLILFLLIFVYNFSIAQKYELYNTEKVKDFRSTVFNFVSNGNFYNGGGHGDLITLKPNLSIEQDKLDLKPFENVQCGISLDNTPFLVSKINISVKASRQDSIFGTYYKKGVTSTKNAKKLFTVNSEGAEYTEESFRSISSEDQSKFLIYYSAPYRKDELYKLGLFVGNSNLEKIVHKEIEIPFYASYLAIETFITEIKISNNGDVYFLFKGEVDPNAANDATAKKEWNPAFTIVKMTSSGEVIKIPSVRLQDEKMLISSACLNMIEKTNTVELIGTAISIENMHPSYFRFTLDGDLFKEEQYIAFPKEIIKNYIPEKSFFEELHVKKSPQIVPPWTYRLRNIIPQENGDIILFAEQYTTYLFNTNLLVCKLSKDNTIEWFTTINKGRHDFYSPNRYKYLSFVPVQTDKGIYVIYDTEFDQDGKAAELKKNEKKEKATILCISLENGSKLNSTIVPIKNFDAVSLRNLIPVSNNQIMIKWGYARIVLE